MLLKLHTATAMGASVIDQIVDYFKGLILADNWPESIRKPDEVIMELDAVVSAEDFEAVLENHHAFLYVGTKEQLPRAFASFYKDQPFKDWIILFKRKDDKMASPIYVFSTQPLQRQTIH